MLLPVSAPFHSSLLKPAAERLAARLADVAFAPPRIPVLHNVDVQPRATADGIRAALAQQAASAVRWTDTIRAFAAQGVTHVVECGPGRVLTGLVRRIDADLQALAVTDGETLEAALAALEGLTGRTRWRRENLRGRSRWSPARRAASAGRSRSNSGAPARRWSAPRPPPEGAGAASAAALAEAGIAGTGMALDVTDAAAVDAVLAAIEQAARADHDPRQQRRHHPRQPAAADEGRRVGRDHGRPTSSPRSGWPRRCCAG